MRLRTRPPLLTYLLTYLFTTGPPPGTTASLGRGHLDYTRSEGEARHPSAHAEQAAPQDLGLWIDRLTTGEQLALAAGIR